MFLTVARRSGLSMRVTSTTVSMMSDAEKIRPSWVRALEFLRSLSSPNAGLLGQGVRFVVVGGTTALVYLLSTTLLASAAGMPFEAALAIGFWLAIAVNFTLQRLFVWAQHEAFALPLNRQFGRYLAVAGMQYLLTAAGLALLPSLLGLSTEAVYLGVAVLLASVNFVIYRNGVFHAQGLQEPSRRPEVGVDTYGRPPEASRLGGHLVRESTRRP